MKLSNAKGRQAVTENGFGISKYDKKKREVVLTDIKFYPPECVEAPPGMQSDEWIKNGMPGAKC